MNSSIDTDHLNDYTDHSSFSYNESTKSMSSEPQLDSPTNLSSNELQPLGPMKLFIGQVPRTMEEEALRPVLEEFGPLEDLAIIRDKLTGAHRGCAFATFTNVDDAEKAITELHNQVTLPQSPNPLQVRPADGQAGASQEHKLFIGMIPKGADEAAIREVFELFGDIEEVYILRHPTTGQSKGCAFLKYKDRNSALQAIEDVNGRVVMDRGTSPLVVKFADSRRQRLQRARNLAAAAYWQMPPTGLPFPQMQQLQQQYIQQMQAFGAAQAAAVGGMNGDGANMSPLSQIPIGLNTPGSLGLNSDPISPTNSFMYYNPYAFAVGAGYGFNGLPTGANGNFDLAGHHGGSPLSGTSSLDMKSRGTSQLEGPAGANLFIYHLPHDLTDADLATAFAPFGTVISAKVYMDKITGESKGFGFVSYDAAEAADAAIASMNGFQIGSKRLKVQHKRIHQRGVEYGMAGMSVLPDGSEDEYLQHQNSGDHTSGQDSASDQYAEEDGDDAGLGNAVKQMRLDV